MLEDSGGRMGEVAAAGEEALLPSSGGEEASMKGRWSGSQSEVAGVCHTFSWKWRGGDFWVMPFPGEGSKRRPRRVRGVGFEDMETIV